MEHKETMCSSTISIRGSRNPINVIYEEVAQGSKNAALPIICAGILMGKAKIYNVPNIADVKTLIKIIQNIGIDIKFENNVLDICVKKINKFVLNDDFFKLRGGFYLVAALLKYDDTVIIKGNKQAGCKIGDRNFDFIFNVFNKFGVKVSLTSFEMIFTKEKETPTKNVILNDLGICVSCIGLLLSQFIKSDDIIKLHSVSKAPELNDLVAFLKLNGSCIERDGFNLTIKNGKGFLSKPIPFRIQEDRIVIASYMVLTVVSNGFFKIHKDRLKYLDSFIEALIQIGVTFKEEDNYVFVSIQNDLQSLNITVDDYPSISTDIQPILTVLLTKLKGESILLDRIFPDRNDHVEQLNNLGANIVVDHNKNIVINGPSSFISSQLLSNDMRCSAALMIAATITKGVTYIENWSDVLRGYEYLHEIIVRNRMVNYKN